MLKPARKRAGSRTIAVLVGGEGREHHLGLHCSVNFIGQAYAVLEPRLGAENIIVITQLREVRER